MQNRTSAVNKNYNIHINICIKLKTGGRCISEPTDSFWSIRILGQNKSTDGWSTISIWLIIQSGLWNEPVFCLVIRSVVIPSHQWQKINRYWAGELSCKLTLLTHSLTDERLNKMVAGYVINESCSHVRLYLHAHSLPTQTVWANINMRSHKKTGSIYT